MQLISEVIRSRDRRQDEYFDEYYYFRFNHYYWGIEATADEYPDVIGSRSHHPISVFALLVSPATEG
jgi:hypothetical protein